MLQTHLQVVSGDCLVLSFLFTFWTLVFPHGTLFANVVEEIVSQDRLLAVVHTFDFSIATFRKVLFQLCKLLFPLAAIFVVVALYLEFLDATFAGLVREVLYITTTVWAVAG